MYINALVFMINGMVWKWMELMCREVGDL